MPASEIELKNSFPDLDLNSGRRESSARHVSRHCGYWFSANTGHGCDNGMQTRYSDEQAVLPSVCPSVFPSNAWIV